MSDMTLAKKLTEHRWFEDAVALLIGTSLVSFGVVFLKHAGLLTGGTAGISLFIHYKLGFEFGAIFFLINVPFYYLAIRRMGWRFTAKTFVAFFLVSTFSSLHDKFIDIQNLNSIYAAVFGGFLFGVGFIILFRHKASLGGFNILALYLIKAGWLLMGADVAIMLISLSVVSTYQLVLSIGCALVLNLIIALNHRHDRYNV